MTFDSTSMMTSRPAALLCVLAVSTAAFAQEYPTKPVTIVVPTAVSSVSDIVARSLAPQLGQRLGQAIVVENRLGAAGNIAAMPDLQATLLRTGIVVSVNAPAEFAAQMQNESIRLQKIINAAGIKAD